MSRSYKKFPCVKLHLSDGKKTANKKFRNISKDKMRHGIYDMLPTKSKRTTNSCDVYEYRSISKQLLNKSYIYYSSRDHGFAYSLLTSLSISYYNYNYFYFSSIKFSKQELYKEFIMK